MFSIDPVTQKAVSGALALRWKDFEDAIQYAAAQEAGAAYIVTRNVDFGVNHYDDKLPFDHVKYRHSPS